LAILYFSDVLKKVGLNPARVKLIRHVLSDKGFRACYEAGKVYEYTCHQKTNFSQSYDYWITFISGKGTLAKLTGCYKVKGSVPDTPDHIPVGVPDIEATAFKGHFAYFDLEPLDILREYENRLVVDWGKGARSWAQKGTTEKPIVAIQPDPKEVFSGFENLILSYDKLKTIIDDNITYGEWHIALSSVNAIYLIIDRETGQQYIGSSYGEGGLLERWACYVTTQHGNDKKIRELICNYPERYHHFQFSILQILPKTVTEKEATKIETLYKNKLLSKKFGMNSN